MNVTGLQGYKAGHLAPTFEVDESDTRETHAKVEGHGYGDTDGATGTCCFCCGIATHLSVFRSGLPVNVIMVSLQCPTPLYVETGVSLSIVCMS